jgi:hypothetical protein
MHFLQSRHNRRTDEYGGTLVNRSRLLRELIEDAKCLRDRRLHHDTDPMYPEPHHGRGVAKRLAPGGHPAPLRKRYVPWLTVFRLGPSTRWNSMPFKNAC